ncbi:TetR family transcriptional regulator, partial [Rhizobium ruizarguesonis]
MAVADEPVDAPRQRGLPTVSSAESKRAHLVAIARRVFVNYGYAVSTTAVVASAASASKQTLYKLFPSKNALFAAVVGA